MRESVCVREEIWNETEKKKIDKQISQLRQKSMVKFDGATPAHPAYGLALELKTSMRMLQWTTRRS